MTQDSLGIRLQAQLLMERKVMLREQQRAIREQILKQQQEEIKLHQIINSQRTRTDATYSPSPVPMGVPNGINDEENKRDHK